MAIVSYTLLVGPGTDTSNHVVCRYYDQDGLEYTLTWFAPHGADNDSLAAEKQAALEETLANAEFMQLLDGDGP